MVVRRIFAIAMSAFLIVIVSNVAHAQAVDPARIEERLPAKRPDRVPDSTGFRGVVGERESGVPTWSFTLKQVLYEGRTAVSEDELRPAYEDYVGKVIGQTQLRDIVTRVSEIYRAKGFTLSTAQVPAQSIVDGVLTIAITEGYVGNAVYIGLPEGALPEYLTDLKAERPATQTTIDRTLLLIDDLNGIDVVDSYFTVDAQDPQVFTLHVEMLIEDVNYSVYADNRGTTDSGRDQVFGSASANSVLMTGDRVTVAGSTVPSAPEELLYGEIMYELPIHTIESWLDLTISAASIDAGPPFDTLDVESSATRFLARLNHPLIRLPEETLWIGLAFDVRHSEESSFDVPTYEDDLRVLRAVASYDWVESEDVTNTVRVEASHGLDALGASENGDALLSRGSGRPQFSKATVEVTRRQALSESFEVSGSVFGQIADGPLLSAEEIVLGGPTYGRAHDYAELSGDGGVSAMAELRYLDIVEEAWLESYELYAFVDGGYVWNLDPVFELDDAHLGSVGTGVRLGLPHAIEAEFELAQPISRSGPRSSDRRLRPYLSLSIDF
jgi:hemolysin activation/secretion protein